MNKFKFYNILSIIFSSYLIINYLSASLMVFTEFQPPLWSSIIFMILIPFGFLVNPWFILNLVLLIILIVKKRKKEIYLPLYFTFYLLLMVIHWVILYSFMETNPKIVLYGGKALLTILTLLSAFVFYSSIKTFRKLKKSNK